MKTVSTTQAMATIGLMAAILCIISPFSLNLPFSPVPISLATMAIYFVIIVLGMKWGTVAVMIYILLGLAGLPVFSNFSGGAGKLLGPTGGYILGYIFMSLICGFVIDKWKNNIAFCIPGFLLGTAVCYLFGTVWLAYQASMTFTQAFFSAVIPYLPGDIVKLSLAILLGFHVRKRLSRANLQI